MNTPDTASRAEALAFLKEHRTGVLATLSPQGTPRARFLYYTCDDQFNIYFLTLANTRKVEDLRMSGEAAFVVAVEDVPQTVQMEGVVEDLSNRPTDDAVINDIFDAIKSNAQYHAPLTRFDAAEVHFFRLKPRWVRWGNFTEGNHTTD